MQLQGVGLGIILVEKSLADGGDPLMGIRIEIPVNGLSCPQGDIVQVNDIVVRSAIDKCAKFAVTNGQRLLEEVGGSVILEYHWGLIIRALTRALGFAVCYRRDARISLLCKACGAQRDCPQCNHRKN